MEFVVFLPLLLAIAFGTIETCRMLYLRQSAKIAAYECSRLAVVPGITLQDLQDQCELFLLNRGLETYTFSCVPATPSSAGFGELITIQINLPAQIYGMAGGWFYQDKIISEAVSIMAEYE